MDGLRSIGAARGDDAAWTALCGLATDGGVLATAAMAVLVSLTAWSRVPAPFDGGVSASAGTFIAHGLLPYRDFWLLYGPLSAVVLAVALVVAPPTLGLLRGLGGTAVVAGTVSGYVIARRFGPDRSARVIAIAAFALPAAITGLDLSAWSLAMAIALAAIAVGTSDRGRAPLVGGILAGLATASRLDVGLYVLVALVIATRSRSAIAGFLAVAAPIAVILLWTVPLPALVEQLVWYPTLGQREFRAVPWPGYGATPEAAAILFLPLVILPRLAIVGALWDSVRRSPGPAFVALSVFALLCQLQTTSRGDVIHFAQASTPALLLFARWVPRAPERSLGRAIVTSLVAAPALSTVLLMASFGLRGEAMDLQHAAAHAAALTTHDEPIFVGLTSNRHTFNNPLLAYYLADRPTAVRHDTYNPGITTRPDVQSEMVRDLDVSGTRVVILDAEFAQAFEPDNGSSAPGGSVLDDYLDASFHAVARYGSYVVAVRNG